MQEKWVYDKKTFDSFAKHWQTNQPVPPELFERIRAARTYRKGESTHSSLQYANTLQCTCWLRVPDALLWHTWSTLRW